MTEPEGALTATRERERERVTAALRRVRTLAYWLDDAFEIPVIRKRIGLDPIVGLLPGAGDWVMWLMSLYILFEAVRLEVPVRLLVRMAWNVAADLIVGAVPAVGDLADAVLKANRKNAALLVEHFGAETDGSRITVAGDPLATPRSTPLGRWSASFAIVAVLLALVAAPTLGIAWLIGQL